MDLAVYRPTLGPPLSLIPSWSRDMLARRSCKILLPRSHLPSGSLHHGVPYTLKPWAKINISFLKFPLVGYFVNSNDKYLTQKTSEKKCHCCNKIWPRTSLWEEFGEVAGDSLKYYKQSLICHSSGNARDQNTDRNTSNKDYSHEVSEASEELYLGYKLFLLYYSKDLDRFFLCPENFSKNEIQSSGLSCLAEEFLRPHKTQLNVWPLLLFIFF